MEHKFSKGGCSSECHSVVASAENNAVAHETLTHVLWLYPKLDCLVYDLACSFKAFGTASAEGRTSSGTLPVAHAQLGFASLRLISKVVGV